MRKTILLAAAAALMTSTAFAADLPNKARAPVYQPIVSAPQWAGFYVGVNAGAAASNKDQSVSGANANGNAVIASGFVPSDIATRGNGVIAGVQGGYNYLFGSYLLGAEIDAQWANVGKSATQFEKIGADSLTTAGSAKLDWFGTARLRAGYLVTPTTLVYGTSGLAVGGVQTSTNIALVAPAPFAASASQSSTTTKTGWTIGGGVEQMLGTSQWSVKAEYLYVNLGHVGAPLNAKVNGTAVNFNTDQAAAYHTVKVGLNYRF